MPEVRVQGRAAGAAEAALSLENDFIRVSFSVDTGLISALMDKACN